MTKSTQKRHQNKPRKPWKDFPLFACGNGHWAKKVRGKRHDFGLWSAPQDAPQVGSEPMSVDERLYSDLQLTIHDCHESAERLDAFGPEPTADRKIVKRILVNRFKRIDGLIPPDGWETVAEVMERLKLRFSLLLLGIKNRESSYDSIALTN